VTADTLTTTSANPTLTGTVADSSATVVVSVAGQTLTATVSGATWSATATAVAEGTYDVTVTATDTLGNVDTATRTGGLVVDHTGPTVRLATDARDPTNADSFLVTVVFSEPVLGFDESDVAVTNGTVAGFGPRGSTTFRFTVIPDADGLVTVTTLAGSATDLAGNPTTADASLTRTADRTPPTATISTPLPLTMATPIPFKVTFSEPVLGFGLNDLVVTNGTAGGLQRVDDRTYTFTVAPDADGDVTVVLPDRAVADAAGNRNPESNTVTIPSIAIDSLVTNSTTPTITGTVRDPSSTVSVTVGDQTFAATVTGTTWSATVPTPLAEGTYDVTATASTSTGPVTHTLTGGLVVDLTAPAVTIDPLVTHDADPVLTGTVNDPAATVVVTIAGQHYTAVVVGTTWSVTVPGLAEGTYDLAVTATDAAGNGGTASLTGGLVVDRTAPTVAIDATGTAAITGTAADAGSGVAGVALSVFDGTHYWDGAAFASDTEVFHGATTTDGWATWSFPIPLPGTYTVHSRATDKAGNVGEKIDPVIIG
jgi:hypothetical protein